MNYQAVKLENVILDWPKFDPEVGGKYEASFLIKKDSTQAEKLVKMFTDSLKNFRELSGKPKATWKYPPLIDGDKKNQQREEDGKEAEEYLNGYYILKVGSKNKAGKPGPLFIDNLKNRVTDTSTVFYRGCKVNAIIAIAPTTELSVDTETGPQKMILCTRYLNAVQFAGHGESLGTTGGFSDLSAFDTIEDIGSPSGAEGDDDIPF